MKNIVKKIVAFWGLLISPLKAYFKKRKFEKEKNKLEEERLESIRDLKANFSKRFNVDIEASIKNMKSQKIKQTNPELLTKDLVNARKYMNENDIRPGGGQVTNIDDMLEHNTNGGYTDKSISEIIQLDNELVNKNLSGAADKELKQKAKTRWVRRE